MVSVHSRSLLYLHFTQKFTEHGKFTHAVGLRTSVVWYYSGISGTGKEHNKGPSNATTRI